MPRSLKLGVRRRWLAEQGCIQRLHECDPSRPEVQRCGVWVDVQRIACQSTQLVEATLESIRMLLIVGTLITVGTVGFGALLLIGPALSPVRRANSPTFSASNRMPVSPKSHGRSPGARALSSGPRGGATSPWRRRGGAIWRRSRTPGWE